MPKPHSRVCHSRRHDVRFKHTLGDIEVIYAGEVARHAAVVYAVLDVLEVLRTTRVAHNGHGNVLVDSRVDVAAILDLALTC